MIFTLISAYCIVWVVGLLAHFAFKIDAWVDYIPRVLYVFKDELWAGKILRLFPPALFALVIACFAYNKFHNFQNLSLLFQISDRCLVSNIKMDDPRLKQ